MLKYLYFLDRIKVKTVEGIKQKELGRRIQRLILLDWKSCPEGNETEDEVLGRVLICTEGRKQSTSFPDIT